MERGLEDVKVGDEIYTQDNIGGRYNVYTVTRITDTMVVCEFKNLVGGTVEVRFNKLSGKKLGGLEWNTAYAYKVTPEVKENVARQNLMLNVRLAMSKVILSKGTNEQLTAILKAINAIPSNESK